MTVDEPIIAALAFIACWGGGQVASLWLFAGLASLLYRFLDEFANRCGK